MIASCFALTVSSCKNENRGRDLAKVYCGACHQAPDPQLLDKKTWQEDVLPYMALFMGLRSVEEVHTIPFEDIERIQSAHVLPIQPVVPPEKWAEIVQYYVENAPEKLPIPKDTFTYHPLEQHFDIEPLPIQSSGISMLHFSPQKKQLIAGNLDGDFIVFDPKQKTEIERIKGIGPPIHVAEQPDGSMALTLVGMMNPNDSQTGIFGWTSIKNHRFDSKKMVKNLSRPVCSVMADLNGDGQQDVVIASFGNFIGDLAWYEWKPDGKTEKHLLRPTPGAMDVVVKDMNNDQHPDIVTLWGQGDEGVSIFYNNGRGLFKEEKVLRFPPVYGSISMQLVDFDKDGFDDIIYANGDNGDHSQILKPYHGLRVFLNDQQNHFSEKYFFPLHGTIRATAADFDKDGDLDIAAASFFPDSTAKPNKNFVFLQNQSPWRFTAFATSQTDVRRWMVMEICDYDQDGQQDVLLGSCKETARQKTKDLDKERIWWLRNKQ